MIERSKRIELRVTAEELRQIHERMQETGISSLTAYMIRMAIRGLGMCLQQAKRARVRTRALLANLRSNNE